MGIHLRQQFGKFNEALRPATCERVEVRRDEVVCPSIVGAESKSDAAYAGLAIGRPRVGRPVGESNEDVGSFGR
jgi:hypothetical protein